MLYFSILFVPLFIILYIPIIIKLKKQKAPIERYIIYAIFYIYIAKVIDEVFFPFPCDENMISMFKRTHSNIKHNIIPFKSIIGYFNTSKFRTIQFYGNILLFMPMGYLLPLIKTNINKLSKVLTISFCISLGIETMQLMISFMYGFAYRSFDVDDIIMNVFGAFLGFVFLKLTAPILNKLTGVELPKL